MALPAAELPTQRDDRPTDDQVVVLHGMVWTDWERLQAARGERPVPRMAFVDGELELMSPSRDHERIKSILGSLVEAWADHAGLEVERLGSWTLEHGPRAGVEPDECFQVLEGELPVDRARPDLVIEVIWTTGRLSKLEAYRVLGLREVWVWRNGTLRVYALRDDGYEEVRGSEVLPGLDLQLVLSLLGERSVTAAVRAFRARLHAER